MRLRRLAVIGIRPCRMTGEDGVLHPFGRERIGPVGVTRGKDDLTDRRLAVIRSRRLKPQPGPQNGGFGLYNLPCFALAEISPFSTIRYE
jgi:hypothetical protein